MAETDKPDLAQAKAQAEAKLRRFFEATPPNVPEKIGNIVLGYNHPGSVNHQKSITVPQIELFCETCEGRRFFRVTSNQFIYPNGYVFVSYLCRNCVAEKKMFALLIEPKEYLFEIMKLGEFPPFGAPIADRIKKLLGTDDLELYRKGVRSAAQGLGVGAASYFRRIVDNQWKTLVREIRDVAVKIGQIDLSAFDAALNETQFSAAVDLLKDAIPQKLLILDRQNPLTLLYKSLSVQLHELNDAECLQLADDTRIVLTALLEGLAEALRDQDSLKNAATRLSRGKA